MKHLYEQGITGRVRMIQNADRSLRNRVYCVMAAALHMDAASHNYMEDI